MTRWTLRAALFALLAAGCSKQPDAVAADLRRLCQGMSEVQSRTYADGFERSAAISRALGDAVHEQATRDFFRTLSSRGTSAARQDALRAFAADHGLPGWRCPALED